MAVDPALPCHQCEWCHRGHHNLCPHVVFLGAPPHHGLEETPHAFALQDDEATGLIKTITKCSSIANSINT